MNTDIQQFLSHIKTRLDAGAAAYGDQSFNRPVLNTTEEILQEIEDIAGWSFVLWVQAKRRLAGVAQALEARQDQLPQQAPSQEDGA
jgi:hypothetical protein